MQAVIRVVMRHEIMVALLRCAVVFYSSLLLEVAWFSKLNRWQCFTSHFNPSHSPHVV